MSAREKVFKNSLLGNITVLNKESVYDKYVYITKYPSGKEDIDNLSENMITMYFAKDYCYNTQIKLLTY